MVLNPNPETSVSPSDPEHPVVTTPINTGSCTLHHFGNRYRPYEKHHWALAVKMSPYFIGSMPIDAFLDAFLPLLLLQDVPLFMEKLFNHVIALGEETGMYDPFVCP